MKCLNVSSWRSLHQQTKGTRDKRWLVEPGRFLHKKSPQLYLFKESNPRYPLEFWSEVIAYHFGDLIGVRVPEAKCAKHDSSYGALIKFFLEIEDDNEYEVLLHGGDIILSKYPEFDRAKGKSHNIYYISQLISQEFFDQLLKILLFDALIGNTDRHQDNWGVVMNDVENKAKIKFAPAFDNGDSLGREFTDRQLDGYLTLDSVQLDKYIYRGKPHLRWSDDGKAWVHMNHFELLKRAKQKWPILSKLARKCTAFTDRDVADILRPIEQSQMSVDMPYQISDRRFSFIKKMICRRRDLLRVELKDG